MKLQRSDRYGSALRPQFRRSAAAAVAAAAMAVALPSRAATQSEWAAPVSGDWTDATKWSTNPLYPDNGTPTAADTYSAFVGASGGYTVTVNAGSAPGGVITVDGLTLANADAANVVATTGTLDVLQDLLINRGTFRLDGGTLRGAVIGGTGGRFDAVSGVLDGVTLRRTVRVDNNNFGYYPPPLAVRNGLTLDGGTFVLSQIDQYNVGTAVQFNGTQTLGGRGTVLFEGNRRPFLRVDGGTLTIGADVLVRGAGDINYYESGIVNLGTIRADSPVQPFIFMRSRPQDVLVNRGLMEARGGSGLIIEGALDNRAGVIRADGADVRIGESSTEAITRHTSSLGTLQALNGGKIHLTGPVDNSNATFTATSGTRIDLTGATFGGGTLATQGTGEFSVLGSTTFLRDVTLGGRFALRPTLYWSGAILDLAGFNFDGGAIEMYGVDGGYGPNAYITSSGDRTIGGTGEIVFHGRNERSAIDNFSGTLTLGPGVTIRTGTGGGQVSARGGATVLNRGTISSEVPGETVRLYRVRNEGTLRAVDNAVLVAEDLVNAAALNADSSRVRLGGNWSNAGGTIRGVNRSDVEITSVPADFGTVTLTDSTLALAGDGTFTTPQIANKFTSVRSNLAVRANATLDNTASTLSLSGYDLVAEGGTVRGGTIAAGPGGGSIVGITGTVSAVRAAVPFRATGSPTANDLELVGTQVLVESGTLRLGGTLGGIGEVVLNGGEVSFNGLTVGPGITVRPGLANGTFGRASDNGSFTNQGTFLSAEAGKTLAVNGTVYNEGLFEARNGGVLRVVRPALFGGNLGGGTWAVYEGSLIDFGTGAAVTTNGGSVILSGPNSTLDAVAPMQRNAGRFSLAAGRDFDSASRRGLTNAGTLSLSAASDLRARSFAQEPGATLQVEIAGEGGEAVSHLLIDGAASLHGVLGVSVVAGYQPPPGSEFEVLTAGLIAGSFTGLTTTGLAAGAGHFEPIYSERNLTLRFVPGPGTSAVPEPTVLAALPAAVWLLRRRRPAAGSAADGAGATA